MSDTEHSTLLARASSGDSAAEEELVGVIYPELRRLAHRYLSAERKGHTLQTTALVHEAWLRLFGTHEVSINDRRHLMALMALQMRRALVDYARQRNAAKGAGSGIRVSLSAAEELLVRPDEDVLAVDNAVRALEAVDPRAAKVVELRFFGGFLESEVAEALGVSIATIKRDWVFARAWLFDRLAGRLE